MIMTAPILCTKLQMIPKSPWSPKHVRNVHEFMFVCVCLCFQSYTSPSHVPLLGTQTSCGGPVNTNTHHHHTLFTCYFQLLPPSN